MKARIFVRVARRPRFVGGATGRWKVDASHKHDQRPLEQGGQVLKTLHFGVDVVVPDQLFNDPMIPVVEIQVQADGTFLDEPVVVQVPVDQPLQPNLVPAETPE
jgi:hypothetical protein